MHEYVMPVARRSALRRRGRRPAGTTRRRAHGAIPPNEGATRQARAGPPADTDYRRQSRPNGRHGDVARRAARSDLRRCLRMPGGPPHGIAEYWRRSGRRRSMHDGRRRRAPPRTPVRETRRRAGRDAGARMRHSRTAFARTDRACAQSARLRSRAAWKINSYDRMSRRKAAPAGARHGDGTQRAARSRISTRGAPMRRARRRPARPASPGRETLIATE